LLLNPIVLLMVAAVIAAAVGMILRRRHIGEDGDPEPRPAQSSPGPKTPDGEIVSKRDRTA
jgi:hypothetical protein